MSLRQPGGGPQRATTEQQAQPPSTPKLSQDVTKRLRLRIAELYNAESFDDLLQGTGRWETLSGDRVGQWSARLTANWRLIVTDEGGTPVVACVIEIIDYH